MDIKYIKKGGIMLQEDFLQQEPVKQKEQMKDFIERFSKTSDIDMNPQQISQL